MRHVWLVSSLLTLKLLSKALELDPEDLEAIHELANLIQLSGDPEAINEAEALLTQLIEKAPESWEVHNDLGRLYLGQDAPESKEKGVRCFEKAAELGGADPLILFNFSLASAELEDLNRQRFMCPDHFKPRISRRNQGTGGRSKGFSERSTIIRIFLKKTLRYRLTSQGSL